MLSNKGKLKQAVQLTEIRLHNDGSTFNLSMTFDFIGIVIRIMTYFRV